MASKHSYPTGLKIKQMQSREKKNDKSDEQRWKDNIKIRKYTTKDIRFEGWEVRCTTGSAISHAVFSTIRFQ